MNSFIYDAKNIGSAIYRNRIAINYSLIKLSKEINVSLNTVRNWEKGKCVPSLINLLSLCNLFKVKVDDVLFYNKTTICE